MAVLFRILCYHNHDDFAFKRVLKQLSLQEADIVVDNYYLTPLRYQSFDFVIIGDDPAAILIPPATEDHGLFACTKPFGMDVIRDFHYEVIRIVINNWLNLFLFLSLKVWILVLVLLVLLPFIIWICAKNLAFSLHNSSGTSLKRVYLFVYSVLVSQSTTFLKKFNASYLIRNNLSIISR